MYVLIKRRSFIQYANMSCNASYLFQLLHICQHIATTGCQFEEWLVLVMSMGSVN